MREGRKGTRRRRLGTQRPSKLNDGQVPNAGCRVFI